MRDKEKKMLDFNVLEKIIKFAVKIKQNEQLLLFFLLLLLRFQRERDKRVMHLKINEKL